MVIMTMVHALLWVKVKDKWSLCVYMCACACVCHKQMSMSRAETSRYTPQYLWGVFSCPCPWYVLLGRKSSHSSNAECNKNRFAIHISSFLFIRHAVPLTGLLVRRRRMIWAVSKKCFSMKLGSTQQGQKEQRKLVWMPKWRHGIETFSALLAPVG